MTPLRLVTYNVRGLRDDSSAVAQVLRELDPDVVCLQEAPRRVGWRGRCAALARRSHLLYAGGGGTTGGTVLMTAVRVDVREVLEYRLQRTPGLHRRGVVMAELSKGTARLAVASIHLGLDAAERARHLTEITGLFNRLLRPPIPVGILAGDVNETAQAPTWSRLAAQYADVGAGDPTPTFSAVSPRHRIDGVFVRGPVEVESYRVLDAPIVTRASDHRPVVVDLLVNSR